jgi:E3 ubiquitin-protein ligase SH3RF
MAFQVGGSGELVQRQGSQRHRRSGSSDTTASTVGSGLTPPPPQGAPHLSPTIQLPAAYIALYPYKPHKADELELKKGAIYTVTERCQDGWFKGTSSRAPKCGVFPGNYVAPIRWALLSHLTLSLCLIKLHTIKTHGERQV